MLLLANLRLPSFSAVISAVENAVQVVQSLYTSIKRGLVRFVFGADRSLSSVTATTSAPTIPATPVPALAMPPLVAPVLLAPVPTTPVVEDAAPAIPAAVVTVPSVASPREGLVPLELFVAESNRREIIFGPGDRYYPESEYEVNLLNAAIHLPVVDSFTPEDLGVHESYLVRPHRLLTQVLNRLSHNPELTPQEPQDPATVFCGCGSCEHGVATTRACRFLTIHRTQMRFRRRATESVAGPAISRWHQAARSTRPVFGRTRR